MRAIGIVLAVGLLGLGACSSSPKDAAVKAKQFRYIVHTGPGGMLYTPNGEPLNGGPLGNQSCADGMGKWFVKVDANKDGGIDQTEFTNDARTMFNRMDLNRDGAIYPSELRTFREPYMVGTKRLIEGSTRAEDSKKGGPVADFSDPVMSADTNLDFKVTLDEMTAQAQDLFKVIDANHDGKIDKAEAVSACPVEVKE